MEATKWVPLKMWASVQSQKKNGSVAHWEIQTNKSQQENAKVECVLSQEVANVQKTKDVNYTLSFISLQITCIETDGRRLILKVCRAGCVGLLTWCQHKHTRVGKDRHWQIDKHTHTRNTMILPTGRAENIAAANISQKKIEWSKIHTFLPTLN